MVERTVDSRIITISGVEFWPLNPRVEDVRIEDIAHALSHMCRYNGHVKQFYSVAQHSVHVSNIVSRQHALWALLHDATEAYLPDVTRPIKGHIHGFRDIEDQLMRVIAEAFRLRWPIPEEVNEADIILMVTEQRDIRNQYGLPFAHSTTHRPLDWHIEPWPAEVARQRFIDEFTSLIYMPRSM